jgi:hypothetical protein
MRKYSIPFMAIMIAIILSSFSKSTTTIYFVYNGIYPQNWRAAYTETWSFQFTQVGSDVLAWFSIEDDNGIITNAEFDEAFATLNQWAPAWNSLDDEWEGWYGDYRLEKKAD